MTTTTQRSDGTGDGDHPSVMSADGCTAPTALTGNRTNGHAGYRAGPSSGGPRTPGQDTPSAGKHTPRSTDSSHTDDEGAAGVEIRVHGIGDHATFSALGTPNYKELVDSRVWIGRVPPVPPHKLRLVNWSRANRKLTRHLSWYLAFPFTLLNVAGYMEPKAKVPRYVMRVGIGVASLCLTIAMAAWITVILETAWRALTDTDDRLTGVVLQAVGPCLLIVFIVYRMIVGRVLVDKGGTLISVFNILALVGMIRYLHSKPASRTGGPLGWYLVDTGSPQNTIDPMTTIVGYTTVIVWCVALFLCLFAIRMRRAGAGFAGAAVLLVLAVSLLHAAGSTLRLFTASLFGLVSSSADRVVHSAPSTRGGEVSIGNVLLPKADQLNSAGHQFVVSLGKALRIDLIPIFFIVMIVVFGGLLWIRLWWRRWDRNAAASEVTDQQSRSGRPKKETQPVSKIHFLVERLPARLAYAVVVAILATAGVWGLMIVGFRVASTRFVDDLMVGLQILGAVAIAMVVLRRPQNVAERLRRTFGAVADIAGFWAPDLHPLAGASYRRGLLSGIRQAINDLVLDYPDEPIALVGHSQGSVVCAWFVRGGHWTERRAEGMTDREALKKRMYEVNQAPSTRIALFTCGSPLHSLYATFFPRYFDDDFFQTTRHMACRSRWRNYWRKTDPIGTALPALPARDNVNVTELKDEETVAHSEYWREERLRTDVGNYLNTTRVHPRKQTAPATS